MMMQMILDAMKVQIIADGNLQGVVSFNLHPI